MVALVCLGTIILCRQHQHWKSHLQLGSSIFFTSAGKSTLSDRLLELCGNVIMDSKEKQLLDSLQVERERGITVKAQTASMFKGIGGQRYLFNLIDTPGHVDFSYEVSRSLAACQGALLLIDSSQGIEVGSSCWLIFLRFLILFCVWFVWGKRDPF